MCGITIAIIPTTTTTENILSETYTIYTDMLYVVILQNHDL